MAETVKRLNKEKCLGFVEILNRPNSFLKLIMFFHEEPSFHKAIYSLNIHK